MLELAAIPFAIFALKIIELTLNTVRGILAASGMSRQAAFVGFVEAAVGITAMGAVVTRLDSPLAILAYAAGFAVGIIAGTKVEEWLALGFRLVQVVSHDRTVEVTKRLRDRGYRVTSLPGSGHAGAVEVGLTLVPRRSLPRLLALIATLDPRAFITVQRSERLSGGSFGAETRWWERFGGKA
jgi:uncharacterized protein YebE (UPF0316 family)